MGVAEDALRDILDITLGWSVPLTQEQKLAHITEIAVKALDSLEVTEKEGFEPSLTRFGSTIPKDVNW